MYEYRDFVTGETKKTRGKFAGWTPKQGPLSVRYAIFKNKKSEIMVPEHCLPKNTKEDIEVLADMYKIFDIKKYTGIIKLSGGEEVA